jgi:hypothetical protein
MDYQLIRCNMIIVKLEEGMGNQMFQYACGKALARKFKTGLVLDKRYISKRNMYLIPRTYGLSRFHIRERSFEDIPDNRLPESVCDVSEEGWLKYSADLINAAGKDSYLTGFWQSWKYFEGIESLLRKKFRFRMENISRQNILLGETMRQTDSVAIHVRRTDYLMPCHRHIGTLPVDYYIKAVSYLTERVARPTFYIFSDDPDWGEENIVTPLGAHVVRGNSDIEDMYLMSRCRHNIIANSSFSWWAAWLNDYPEKMVLVPHIWFPGSSVIVEEIDLIPPDWISINYRLA